MLPNNDQTCGWITVLPARKAKPALSKNIRCEWLIIGAGYTGLSAARKLAQLKPNASIVLIDANKAGEGASSRNSGYLVDSTLNDGHMADKGLENYLAKYRLNQTAVETVRSFVNDEQIDCDWNECGKFHATSLVSNERKLQNFSSTLMRCGIAHDYLEGTVLDERLGTSFYHAAVHTHGGVMLQPAKLARGMIEKLPANVTLFENTPVTDWKNEANRFEITTPGGKIRSEKLFFCTNGFLPSLGLQNNRAFPLTLTASLTRPLTDTEYLDIGAPMEWGVLSAQAMGATVRLTQDRRIMIRNTAEAFKPINMTEKHLAKRQREHNRGIVRRFPNLPENIIDTTWSGVTCISGNSANIFKEVDTNLFVAGCYNGGGIGLATLFGEQLAVKALGIETRERTLIESRNEPNWLPPQPFLHWGVKARLIRDKWYAEAER